jgi:8-oxo-dGTP pyrophosphatase MutT (NUDIX family)
MRKVFPWIRGMTLGARVAVIDGQGRFLLVKHTYSTPWIFPGGGVERGETCLEAALREMDEEAAIVATGPLQLHGIFSNHADFPGDHLLFYVCRQFEQKVFTPNREIEAAEFFAVDALPPIVSAGSRRRIEELVSGRGPSGTW